MLYELLNLSLEDVSYLAGFFDGEGCITIKKVKDRKTGIVRSSGLRLQVGNLNYEVLARLKRAFGGRIKESIENNKPYFRWEVTKGAYLAIKVLEPYLIVKKEQAKIGIEFAALKRIRRGYLKGKRDTMREALSILHHSQGKEAL